MNPPTARPLSSFDAAFLDDEDLDDLASFTGLSREQCRRRLRSYSLTEHAEAWRRADPKTPDEILDFYRQTDLYLWELMQWHASTDRLPYWQALATLAEQFPPGAGYRRVYDFGCGVGTDGLFLASQGYDVTLVDVDGPAFRFAKHRFERRALEATFVESRSLLPEPEREYDAVVCFDVFEHLPDPLEAALRLVRALRPGGLLLQQAGFDTEANHPCHLSEGGRAFAGLRWGIHLAGLGLRSDAPLIYRKVTGWQRAVQRTRYQLWWRTGIWTAHVPRLK